MTDREKAGLRGPVKGCVEETEKRLTTTEYDLDGRLLTTRTSRDSGWVTTKNYDAGGRLVKESWAKSGEPTTETLYAYDEAGNLKEVRDAGRKGNLIADPSLLAFSIGEDGTIIPDHRGGDPPPDLERWTRTIIQCRYEYDQNGNWTERTTTYPLQSGESSTVDRRTITYF